MVRSCPAPRSPRTRSTSRTTTARPANDYDEVSQDSGFAKVEYDVRPTVQLRSQLRYNQAHRTAVISTIQNPAAYNPATELVTIARQGNERENRDHLEPDQRVDRRPRRTDVARAHRHGRVHERVAVRADARRPRHAPARRHLRARRQRPGDGHGRGPDRRVQRRHGVDRRGVGVRHRRRRARACSSPAACASSATARRFLARDAAGVATTDVDTDDTLVSGKVGALYKLTDQGNVYFAWGTTKTPPGTANFTLSAQPNNQNNPNVDPQISTNVEVGSKWDFYGSRLSLTGAAFRTKNENVIFTVDATAVPPVFNQDDAQRVTGASLGVAGRIIRELDVTANFAYLDSENLSQNPVNAGKRLTLTPAFSGSVWATYTTPIRLSVGGGVRFTDAVYVNAANTIKSPGYQIVDAMATYDADQPGVAAPERLQRDERDLHPQHQQQRRPLQPGAPADGHAHRELRVLRLAGC